jgi:Na+/melibiose symporter-like transporter
MLNVGFFKNPRFTAASLSITLVFFALFGSIFFLTQYMQFVLGYTPLQAGLRLAPMALVLLVAAPVAGQLVARVGTKALVAVGMAVGAAGLWYLSRTTPMSGYWHILGGLVILGGGLSVSMVPATESIMGSLPPGKAGVGSAMNDTTREIGGALGVAILGSVLASHYSTAIAKAFGFLPEPALAAARSSLGGAIEVGQQVGGAFGQNLIATAKSTFITAMGASLLIAALVALGGSVISALWLPNRPRHEAGHESARDAEMEPIATEVAAAEELAARELVAGDLAAEALAAEDLGVERLGAEELAAEGAET